jgi:small subunit ribosomal protein S24e
MKVEITEKVENPMLKRTELKFFVEHGRSPTPRRLEVKAQLASQLGAPEDLIVIEKIASLHGKQVASGIARVYSSKEQLDVVELGYFLKRGLPKEEKPPEEKAPEAPKKEEKPKEEKKAPEAPKKEEKPQEEKKEKKAEAPKKEETAPEKPEKKEG